MKTLITFFIFLVTSNLFAQSAENRSTLSPKALEAYTVKAESKVTELYGYLELLTDAKGNKEMKQQAAEAAAKLFIANTTGDNIFEPKTAGVTVKSVLESAKGQVKKHSFKVLNFTSEVITETPLKKEWIMNYQLLMNGVRFNISQSFYIVSENKQFGKTTKTVLNTYLGAITFQ